MSSPKSGADALPARVSVDPGRNAVTLELVGRLSVAEATAALAEIGADERLRQAPTGLVDATALAGIDLEARDVRQLAFLASQADQLWTGGRWAIVAPSDLIYGMARMYQLIRSEAPYELGVFRSTAEARRWLAASRPGSGPGAAASS